MVSALAQEFGRHQEIRTKTCSNRERFERILQEKGDNADYVDALGFAVVTGCLRISRESIFTVLNNLNVISVISNQYDEYFGFSQQEVDRLLKNYGCEGSRMEAALRQICDKGYQKELLDAGFQNIWNYGICFCKKDVAVKLEKTITA